MTIVKIVFLNNLDSFHRRRVAGVHDASAYPAESGQ
jgi:hypothetical protein